MRHGKCARVQFKQFKHEATETSALLFLSEEAARERTLSCTKFWTFFFSQIPAEQLMGRIMFYFKCHSQVKCVSAFCYVM